MCGVLIVLLLAAGCAGQQAGNGKNASGNLTLQNPGKVPLKPTLTLNSLPTVTSYAGAMPDTMVSNIRILLVSWNEKMYWNLSSEQINDYSVSMENGVLKKYRTHPDFPHALYIPDRRQFHYETGGAFGFTPGESEAFVRALDEYRQKEWQMLDCRDYVNNSPCPQRTILINFTVQPRPLETP